MAKRTVVFVPLISGLLAAGAALAAAPVPLTVQPVSARVRIETTCSPVGVSSAALTGPISSISGLTASVMLSASVTATQASFTLSGTGNGSAGDIYFEAFLEVDALVPQIGDALTPVMISLENLTESGATWSVRSINVASARLPASPSCPTDQDRAAPTSVLLGSPLGDAWGWFSAYDLDLGPWPARATHPVGLLPGDTARIPIKIAFHLRHTAGSGSFSDSVAVAFRRAATTVGNGDVNGDGQVNVLDTTLTRRALAGLPYP